MHARSRSLSIKCQFQLSMLNHNLCKALIPHVVFLLNVKVDTQALNKTNEKSRLKNYYQIKDLKASIPVWVDIP